jgi:hypothetical protein
MGLFDISDENVNVINLGALGTVVLDLETTLTIFALATAVILNIVKIIANIKRIKGKDVIKE